MHGVGSRVLVSIAGLPIAFECGQNGFASLFEEHYCGFLASPYEPCVGEFAVEPGPPHWVPNDQDVTVHFANGRWRICRGDFEAEYDPVTGRGRVRLAPNPYSLDSLLRIVHTILLAREGGFLVHAAGAIRNARAFLFAGVSGSGKTTLCRLAPSDVTLLSDEVGYVRREPTGYVAYGTPFAGELGIAGVSVKAPVAAVYFLAHSRENRLEPLPRAEALRRLLRNILFFAEDSALATRVFEAACDFVQRIPIWRLGFLPDARVWELIR